MPRSKTSSSAATELQFEVNDIVLINNFPALLLENVSRGKTKEWKAKYFGYESIQKFDECKFYPIHAKDVVNPPKKEAFKNVLKKVMPEVVAMLKQKEGGWGSKKGRGKKVENMLVRTDRQALKDVETAQASTSNAAKSSRAVASSSEGPSTSANATRKRVANEAQNGPEVRPKKQRSVVQQPATQQPTAQQSVAQQPEQPVVQGQTSTSNESAGTANDNINGTADRTPNSSIVYRAAAMVTNVFRLF